MGYGVSVTLENVRILAKDVPAAIQAMLELMGAGDEDPAPAPDTEEEEEYEEPERTWEWVDAKAVVDALRKGNLEDALHQWRYSSDTEAVSDVDKLANLSEYGNIDVYSFTGENWGNDYDLWHTLAPFLTPDAVITMYGEDDTYWRFIFTDGTLKEQHGHIVWE